MIPPSLTAISLVVASAAAAAPAIQYAQVTIQQRIIIRVPTRVMPPPPAPITRWKSKSFKKCFSIQGIAGAIPVAPDAVDLILPGGKRIRAELESSCPALDYYSGFYLRPDEQGMICAGRDSIHARSGGECQISRFRKMVPVR